METHPEYERTSGSHHPSVDLILTLWSCSYQL